MTAKPTIEINGETFAITIEGGSAAFIRGHICKGAFGWGDATLSHGDTLRIDLPSDLTPEHKAQLSALVIAELFRELRQRHDRAQAGRLEFLSAILHAAPAAISRWSSTTTVLDRNG